MITWFSLVVASLMWGPVDGIAVQKKQAEDQGFIAHFETPVILVNGTSAIHYTIQTQQTVPSLSIILCQTSATTVIDSTNAFEIVPLLSNICVHGADRSCPPPSNGGPSIIDAGSAITSMVELSQGTQFNSATHLANFFLCVSKSAETPVCDAYSQVFNLVDPSAPQAIHSAAALTVFSSLVPVTQTHAAVLSVVSAAVAASISNDVGLTTSSSTSAPTSWLTTSLGPTGTTTITPTPTASSDAVKAASSSKSKGGLSTGALVGIIIGAVGAVLILALFALLCLRRRKRTGSNTVDSHGSQPEHILLTQPYHSVSESPDLITEKNSPATLGSILETPLSRPVLPQNPRHSYDSLNASAPYSGLAAAAPKRKQAPPPPVAQNVHSRSLLSRELSDASGPLTRGLSNASGPISPRSTVRSDGDDFEEYHDVPIYGDARHTPTVYQSHPSLQAPFLSEEGMSAEQIARLEEEERRIDAAIAAAERR